MHFLLYQLSRNMLVADFRARSEKRKEEAFFIPFVFLGVRCVYCFTWGLSGEQFFFFTNKGNKPSLYSVWASVCIVRRFVFISRICPLLQFAATKQFSINYFIVLLLCNFITGIKFLVTVPIPLSTKKEMRIDEMITK